MLPSDMRFMDPRIPRQVAALVLERADELAARPVALGYNRAAELAAQLGVRVSEARISTHGRIVREGNALRIYTRPDLPRTRKNFTIAHELAHMLLNEALDSVGLASSASNERDTATRHRAEERLCDFIAARLLMPATVMASALARAHPHVAAVFPIAFTCGVSFTAALIRVFESAPGSLALVRWSRPRFAPDAGLQADWVYRSPLAPQFIGPGDVGVPDWVTRFAESAKPVAELQADLLPQIRPTEKRVQLVSLGRGKAQDVCAMALDDARR